SANVQCVSQKRSTLVARGHNESPQRSIYEFPLCEKDNHDQLLCSPFFHSTRRTKSKQLCRNQPRNAGRHIQLSNQYQQQWSDIRLFFSSRQSDRGRG